MEAYRTGNTGALANILAEDAVLYADGGGKRRAALNPIRGRDRIVRLFIGAAQKWPAPLAELRPAIINGPPGCVATLASGDLHTIALEIGSDRITAIYAVRNPDKLKHIANAPGPRA